MNGIDVLEQDGFREVRGSNPSSPRAVGVITNHTGFDVEGRRTIDILAKAPGIKLVAIFSPEHGIFGAVDTTALGDVTDAATGVRVYSVYGGEAKRRHERGEGRVYTFGGDGKGQRRPGAASAQPGSDATGQPGTRAG